MNDDEFAKQLKRLAQKFSESDAILKRNPLVSRKIEEAILLADFDRTRALEIVMELCEEGNEFSRVITDLALERFLRTWGKKGEEQH